MNRDTSWKLGALWAVKQIEKTLPLTSDEPSADLVYHLDKISEKIKKMKEVK